MRPLLSSEAAAIVTGWQAKTGASASDLVSQAVEFAATTFVPHEQVVGVLGMGARLRAARKARRWTQDELAADLGVSRALVSFVERGGAANAEIVRWVLGEEGLTACGP